MHTPAHTRATPFWTSLRDADRTRPLEAFRRQACLRAGRPQPRPRRPAARHRAERVGEDDAAARPGRARGAERWHARAAGACRDRVPRPRAARLPRADAAREPRALRPSLPRARASRAERDAPRAIRALGRAPPARLDVLPRDAAAARTVPGAPA